MLIYELFRYHFHITLESHISLVHPLMKHLRTLLVLMVLDVLDYLFITCHLLKPRQYLFMLKECDEHEDNRVRVEPIDFAWEALLVPTLYEQGHDVEALI